MWTKSMKVISLIYDFMNFSLYILTTGLYVIYNPNIMLQQRKNQNLLLQILWSLSRAPTLRELE